MGFSALWKSLGGYKNNSKQKSPGLSMSRGFVLRGFAAATKNAAKFNALVREYSIRSCPNPHDTRYGT